MNKFVLSVCKCRKKLSHLNCFNNYIDMKQNGDVNIEILCSKCNFKYEFEYPYNSLYLSFFSLQKKIWFRSGRVNGPVIGRYLPAIDRPFTPDHSSPVLLVPDLYEALLPLLKKGE
jgi:hypothetical protein